MFIIVILMHLGMSSDSSPECTFINVLDTTRLQRLQREVGGSSRRTYDDPDDKIQYNVRVVCWCSRCKGLKTHRMDITATHQMRYGMHPSTPSRWGALTTRESSTSQVLETLNILICMFIHYI